MAPDQAIPAGWYPDPYSVSELRWWDGSNWTESVHPPAAPPPPVSPVPLQPSAEGPAQPATPQSPASPVQQAPVEVPTPASPPIPSPLSEALPAQVPEPIVASNPFPMPPETPQPPSALPSRRQLRSHDETESTLLGAPATATEPQIPMPAPQPVKPAGADSQQGFDWLPDGRPLGNSTTAFPSPSEDGLSIFASSGTGDTPSSQSGPVPAKGTPAWGQPENGSSAGEIGVTRKSTTSGWFIALMPLIFALLAAAAVKGAENYPRYIPDTIPWWMLAAFVLAALYVITIILAIADRSKLDWAGHRNPAHWAWALLTAPVYLLARTISVKRETGRVSPLLIVWLVLAAALVGAWFAAGYFMPEMIEPYQLPFL